MPDRCWKDPWQKREVKSWKRRGELWLRYNIGMNLNDRSLSITKETMFSRQRNNVPRSRGGGLEGSVVVRMGRLGPLELAGCAIHG